MDDEEHTKNWPLSNYPILMALLMLIATAASLGLGSSESYANQIAIYAYFLLVTGVAIRFFELTLPGTLVQKIKEKLQIGKNVDVLAGKNKSNPGFFSDVTKNVLSFLLIFFFISMGYGALVDWFFVEGFIKQLGYTILVFLALHLVLRYGMRA
ncbi:Uncharacterised protein [uncultured archaeon]|nr:Uncharacterised protein [uncultured archaeon]